MDGWGEMKPRKPPRRCVICGEAYNKTGSAKTCGAPECRAEVVRLRHEKWRRENPQKWNAFGARFYAQNPQYRVDYMKRCRARKNVKTDA
jgi:hypothetical protein